VVRRKRTDVPDLDERWPQLLVAARVWRASIIEGAMIATRVPTERLLDAIAAFDEKDPN
jgi:hypothetical protein